MQVVPFGKYIIVEKVENSVKKDDDMGFVYPEDPASSNERHILVKVLACGDESVNVAVPGHQLCVQSNMCEEFVVHDKKHLLITPSAIVAYIFEDK